MYWKNSKCIGCLLVLTNTFLIAAIEKPSQNLLKTRKQAEFTEILTGETELKAHIGENYGKEIGHYFPDP